MTELDVMKEDKNRILAYWRKRAIEEEANQSTRRDISITIDTLQWFLWMIDNES